MGARTKYDYDDEAVYTLIGKLALNGLNDGEIADCLGVNGTTFSCMKKGNYSCWDDVQNSERGEKIRTVLAVNRRKIIATARQTYIKAALGSIKIKSKVMRHVEVACECGGDANCPKCGGVGRIPLSERVVVQETESDTPPNLAALTNILMQHDPQWINKSAEEERQEISSTTGIDIASWIKKELSENGTDTDNSVSE